MVDLATDGSAANFDVWNYAINANGDASRIAFSSRGPGFTETTRFPGFVAPRFR